MVKISLKASEVQQFRVLFLLAAVLYPLWWIPFVFIVGNVEESLLGRGLVGLLSFTFFLGTYMTEKIKQRTPLFFTIITVILTAHYFFLIYRNHMHIAYSIGAYIVVGAVAAGFNSLTGLKIYCVTTALFSTLATFGTHTEFPREIFYFGIITMLFVSYMAQLNRLKVIRELNETEKTLKEAQKIANIGVLDFDLTKDSSEWSEEAYEIFDIAPDKERPTLERYFEKIHPDEQEKAKIEMQRMIEHGIPFTSDYRALSPKGLKYLQVKSVPVKDSDGKVTRVKTIVLDLTERKKSEVMAAQSFKMASLGEMAGGIAHEINNPLAIIKLSVGGLLKELTTPVPNIERTQKLAMKIDSLTDRLAKIIKSLRYFCRDGSQDSFEKINMKNILDETLSLCVERLNTHGIKLDVQIPQQEIFLECRPIEISQVLLNLINNSIDATQTQSEKWLSMSFTETSDKVEIKVKDSGTGIPENIETKLFQPFFSTKEFGKGTGLGLSISLGLIKSHQGELYLDKSSPNTCFVITLPKTRPRPNAVAS